MTIVSLIDAIMLLKRARSGPSLKTSAASNGTNAPDR
jgi:hypothetical protein